jgi:hypothetical protein
MEEAQATQVKGYDVEIVDAGLSKIEAEIRELESLQASAAESILLSEAALKGIRASLAGETAQGIK